MKIDQLVIAQVLTTAIAFLIFFWIAKKLFWTRVLGVIEQRQARIRNEFDRIEAMQRKVQELEAEYSRRIADIETEARQRMQEAIAQGRQMAEQIEDRARSEANDIVENAQKKAGIEIDKARAELKDEIVRITLAATEKIIREQLNDAKHTELVGSFIEELNRK